VIPKVGDPAASFPKSHRVLKSRQFRWILRGGRRFYSPNFTFVFRGGTPVSRVGLTVSRKVGNAIQRNRIKRVVRETFRLNSGLMKDPLWIVVIAKPGAALVDNCRLSEQVISFFKEAHSLPKRAPNRGRRQVRRGTSSSKRAAPC